MIQKMAGRALRPDPKYPVFLVHGEYEFLAKEWLGLLLEGLAEAGVDDPPTRFDGQTATIHDILNEARSGTLFCDRRPIVVENAEVLKVGPAPAGGKKGAKAAERPDVAALKAYLADPADFTVLVFLCEAPIAPLKAPREGSLLMAACHGEIADCGCVAAFEKIWPDKLSGWIVERARDMRLRLSHDDAAFLQEKVGDDLRTLAGELEKFSVYLGAEGGVVDRVLIDELAAENLDYQVYGLMDLVWSGNMNRAQLELSRLLENKVAPTRILATFAIKLRQMWQARRLMDTGWFRSLPKDYKFGGKSYIFSEVKRIDPADIAPLPQGERDYLLSQTPMRIYDAVRAARQADLEHIERQILKCFEIDQMSKGIPTRTKIGKDETALQMFLLGLPQRKKRTAAAR